MSWPSVATVTGGGGVIFAGAAIALLAGLAQLYAP
jgi:hypothetical protein